MKICVDFREKNKIPSFKEYISSGKIELIDGVKIVSSKAGDVYTEDGLVGIERKKEDFIPSVFNKQIEKQLKELKDNFQYPYLFIEYEGIMDVISKTPNVDPDKILGMISSIIARQKVTVCFVSSFYVPIVCKTISKFYDGKTISRELNYTPLREGHTPSKRNYTIKELKLDLIGRIPGVGSQKALKLLEHFDYSILKIVNSENKEIMDVSSIGKTISEKIKEILK